MSLFNFIAKVNGVIPNHEAIELIDEYKRRVGTNTKTKSRSVWFSLQELEEIVEEIKRINQRDKTKFGNGVRVYFAKYKGSEYENVDTPHGKKNYNGKRTVVIIPTYTIGLSGTIFYDDISREDLLISLIEQKKNAKQINFMTAYNHGELCPPETGCEGSFL